MCMLEMTLNGIIMLNRDPELIKKTNINKNAATKQFLYACFNFHDTLQIHCHPPSFRFNNALVFIILVNMLISFRLLVFLLVVFAACRNKQSAALHKYLGYLF